MDAARIISVPAAALGNFTITGGTGSEVRRKLYAQLPRRIANTLLACTEPRPVVLGAGGVVSSLSDLDVRSLKTLYNAKDAGRRAALAA